MRFLIVPDSFKGSTSSPETARYIQAGITAVFPDSPCRMLPVADGGEGTVEALVEGCGGAYQCWTVRGPLGAPVEARFGILPDGTAVIEMAQASGLPLLTEEQRNPELTSTYGTGELISRALDLGCRRILMGIGGSATNDGGAGMAQALGARFLDGAGQPLPPGGAALALLERIDRSGLDPRLKETQFLIASDVTNPLCGPNGASVVYGPQKGADAAAVRRLDAALARYAEKLEEAFGEDFSRRSGAGAAGGLGAGLMAFCGGRLRPGIELIFERLGLEEQVAWADVVFTGEGRVDATSAQGKLLSGIGGLGLRYHKPVIALAGSVGQGAEAVFDCGVTAILPLADGPLTLEESLTRAPELIRAAAERAARLLWAGVALKKQSD